MTRGLYQHPPPLPVIPGSEVAATVVHGPEGTEFRPGDRATGFVLDGGFAERVAVPVSAVVRVPSAVSPVSGRHGRSTTRRPNLRWLGAVG